MSRLGRLRDFQEGLAQRLRVVGAGAPSSACLAVEAGGEGWRIRLDETAEVLPVSDITTAPLCRPWFIGLANVHGRLVSVVDFAALAGGGPTPRSPEARVVVFCGALRRTWRPAGVESGGAAQRRRVRAGRGARLRGRCEALIRIALARRRGLGLARS